MIYILYTVHIVVCLFLILVVLLQQGRGADLSVFGGGSTQTAFGARGAATLLHKLTVGCFIAFIVTTISIGLLQTGGPRGSVMTDSAVEEPAAEPAAAPEAPDEAAQEQAAPAETAPEEAPAEAEPSADGASPEGAGDTPPPPAGDQG